MFRPLFNVLSRGRLTVLLFHKVPVVKGPLEPGELDLAGFEKMLRLVKRMFHVLPLDEALLALRAGNLPPRAACITFDDGYPDWLRGVVPVLEREQAHATFFITTGQFNGLPMWNERILQAVSNAPANAPLLELDGLPPLAFGSVVERQHTITHLDQYLKYREPGEKEQLLQRLELHTGSSVERVPVMTVAELRELHSRGFGIGGHAVSHPILARCTPAQAYAEIGGAREELEAMLGGGKVTAFAYPNGVPAQDFGPEHVEMVRRAGYTSAVTTYKGVAKPDTSLFQIPRFTPWGPSDTRMHLQVLRNLMQRAEELTEPDRGVKRALMVAFHFPPQAGSSGILRTLNFVKYLPRHGWEGTVLTARPGAYVETRNDLVESIPPQTRVLRATALDAAKHLSVFGKYPSLLAIPDRWSSWWIAAVWAGMKEIRRQRPSLIWSTYPISTAHLIGGTLSHLSGIPWVADFRDPMVSDSYPANRLQRRVWRWLESWVVRRASHCVFTTERAAETYRARYPLQAAKCVVIENGYDEEAFEGNRPRRPDVRPDQFLLLHSGIIYPKDRDPSAFFSAIHDLIEEGAILREHLKIRFRAPQHEKEVRALAEQYGISDVVDIASAIPYREAISEMLGADVLIVFQGSNFNTQIPAKIYEYLRADRDILALLDLNGDTANQLRKFELALLLDIASKQMIKDGVRNLIGKLDAPNSGGSRSAGIGEVKSYSRESRTKVLAKVFDLC